MINDDDDDDDNLTKGIRPNIYNSYHIKKEKQCLLLVFHCSSHYADSMHYYPTDCIAWAIAI